MTDKTPVDDRVLTPGEVAGRFGVTTATLARWARTGKLPAIRTPGGQRRYREADITALLEGDDT
jgi:excisionase family DNA binding protein